MTTFLTGNGDGARVTPAASTIRRFNGGRGGGGETQRCLKGDEGGSDDAGDGTALTLPTEDRLGPDGADSRRGGSRRRSSEEELEVGGMAA